MEVEFWGIEFNKRKNSTKIPTSEGVKKEVRIKGNFGFENQFQSTKCSIVAPSFFVTGAVGYNYCKAWDNYYWITNISFDIDGAEYITCEIDVLASWRSFIQNSKFYVARCADSAYYNTDIYDQAISVEDGNEVSYTATTDLGLNSGTSYIVRVMGSGSTGISSYVFSNLAELGHVFNPLFDDYESADIIETLDGILNYFICSPSDNIYAAYATPFTKNDFTGGDTEVTVGWWKTGYLAKRITNPSKNGLVTLAKPASLYSDFRRTDQRCSAYYLQLPGVGTVTISPSIIEMSLRLYYEIDMETGSIFYRLEANGSPVATYEGCIFVSLGLGNTSGDVGALVSSVTQTAIGAGSGNISLAVNGIVGIGEALLPQTSIASTAGGMASMRGNNKVLLTGVYKHTGEFLTNDYGRPCCKNLTLGDLSGFVMCANASIDISSTSDIRDRINNYLNTGFFME